MRRRAEAGLRAAAVGTGVLLVLVVAPGGRPGGRLEISELRTLDYRFRLRGVNPRPVEHVLLVALDGRSLAAPELGPWPWDRAVHARLVEALSSLGADAIAFDVFFVEPGRSAAGDEKLAQALARSGRVFLGVFSQSRGEEARPSSMDERLGTTLARGGAGVPRAAGFVPPLEGLVRAAAGVGYTNILGDADGIYRRFYPVLAAGTTRRAYLWLPLAIHRVRSSARVPESVSVRPGRYVDLGPGLPRIPVDRRGRSLISTSGRAIPTVSCVDVLRRTVAPEQVRGKVCVIGATATGLYDVRPTPINPRSLGVELLAESIEALFAGSVLRQTDPGTDFLIALFLGVAVVLLPASLTPLFALLASGAVFLAYNLVAVHCFAGRSLVLPMAAPGMAMLLGYAVVALALLVSSERSAWKLRTSLSLYLPPDIAAEIAADPDAVRLEGEKRTLTILVSDIRGFTPFAEGHDPETVVGRLNEYFAAMTEVAWAHGATVDKFIGDGLFIFFNAPQHQEDHAQRALHTAIEMVQKLRDLNLLWQQRGWQPFRIGIAINTGEAIVGNMGALGRRVSYTAIGDAVNVTFYLEGMTGELGEDILLTQNTRDLLQDGSPVELVGDLELGGRKDLVTVYSLAVPEASSERGAD